MAATEPRPRKVDRDEVFLEYTKSICPVCKTVIDAEGNVRDNRVILRKRSREHGVFEALVYSDAELYMAQQRFNKPGTILLEFQTEVVDGRPLDCGLCPEHKQHACLGIIEVNTATADADLFCEVGGVVQGSGSTRQHRGWKAVVELAARCAARCVSRARV